MELFNKRDLVEGELNLNKKREMSYLEDALKPLIVVFRYIGIKMNPIDNRVLTKRQKYSSLLFVFVMCLANVSSNISFTITAFNVIFNSNYSTDIPELEASSVTGSWNLVLDTITYDILAIGSHAVLLSFRWQSKWKETWKNLQRIETDLKIGDQFIRKCRPIVYGLIAVFFVVYKYIRITTLINNLIVYTLFL